MINGDRKVRAPPTKKSERLRLSPAVFGILMIIADRHDNATIFDMEAHNTLNAF